tara:strand:+ start:111767 stop:112264 length:498 start_codon:yes stop_codon:yes gene_type:complete
MHNALNSIVKKSKVVILLLSSVFIGCQDIKRPEKPENLIQEDKMVEVLVDVHLFNSGKSYNRMPLQQTGLTPHQFIYEKHGIDSLQYEKSNAYYGADLDKYAAIHARAKAILEKRKSEVDTLLAREVQRRDSISKVNDSLRLLKNKTGTPTLQVSKSISRDTTGN